MDSAACGISDDDVKFSSVDESTNDRSGKIQSCSSNTSTNVSSSDVIFESGVTLVIAFQLMPIAQPDLKTTSFTKPYRTNEHSANLWRFPWKMNSI
jgi:hypothetical protein